MSITPRRLASDGPEKGANAKQDGLKYGVEKAAKTPEKIGDFLFEEFRDPDEFLAAMALDSPRAFASLPMAHDRAKASGDLFSSTGFFPILQQCIDFPHVAVSGATGVTMEAKPSERAIDSVNRRVAKEFAPEVEIGGKFAAVWDA